MKSQGGSIEIVQTPLASPDRNPFVSQEDLDTQQRKEAVERYRKFAEKTGWKAKLFQLNFFRVVVLHVCLTSLLGAGILKALCPQVFFLDCYFTAVSAITVSALPGIASFLTLPALWVCCWPNLLVCACARADWIRFWNIPSTLPGVPGGQMEYKNASNTCPEHA